MAPPDRKAIMSLDPRGAALSALSQFLVADATVGDTLLKMCEITTDALPAAQFAGISMLDEHGRPSTRVYTDEESPQVDAGQYESGRGPCLDAWRRREVVRIDDMAVADAYPEFCALGEAMKSRAVIEQAKGMLMAHSPDLDGDGAFDLLRRASQRENAKSRDIAQRMVDRQ